MSLGGIMSRYFDFPVRPRVCREKSTAGAANYAPLVNVVSPSGKQLSGERPAANGGKSQGGEMNRKLGLVRVWRNAVRAGVIATLAFALSGCVAFLPVPTAPQEDSTGEAGTAEVEVVQPATFDPDDPNFQFFDPCHDLTDEQFASIGLPPVEQIDKEWNVPNRSKCKFNIYGSDGVVASHVWIATDLASLEEHQDIVQVIDRELSPTLPGSYSFYFPDDDGIFCMTSVPTDGGRLHVAYHSYWEGLDMDGACNAALSYLEKVVTIRGGLNANSI